MLLAAALLLPRLVTSAPPDAVKLAKPGVQYRMNVASASSRPWVTANGWRLERGGSHPFFYDVTGDLATLAAAEAFAYQREVVVQTDAAGTARFNTMLRFLESIGEGPADLIADVAVIDDGSAETGEVMNLLARHNLLYRPVAAPDPKLPVNIKLGSPEYPKASAANPNEFAQKIRQQITDEKRTLRVYGSEVVIARLTGEPGRLRLHLINYGDRPVNGVRIRVLGAYPNSKPAAFELPDAKLEDYAVQDGSTEFTLLELKRYAVVDLFTK
jgi:hypothetical protein